VSKDVDFLDRERLESIKKIEEENFPPYGDPWAFKDYPIERYISRTFINPFTGEEDPIAMKDPRFEILEDLLDKYNVTHKYNAVKKITEGASHVLLKDWSLKSLGDQGSGISITQTPFIYYNIEKYRETTPVVYSGTRKALIGKVFSIIGYSKNFTKVMDIDTGIEYRVDPKELEVTSVFPIGASPSEAVESIRRAAFTRVINKYKPGYEAMLRKAKGGV